MVAAMNASPVEIRPVEPAKAADCIAAGTRETLAELAWREALEQGPLFSRRDLAILAIVLGLSVGLWWLIIKGVIALVGGLLL